MKIEERTIHGFVSIYYKGKPVKHDTESKVENVLIARNKLHAKYLRWRYKDLKLRVVVEKWLDFHAL